MNSHRTLHQILLQPTDVLFFRDGRPMGGSLAGHTAAWPLPDVINHALHAALHRAGLSGVHGHDHHRADGSLAKDVRKFGSLLTAGPFPVFIGNTSASRAASGSGDSPQARWFFPRPKDAQQTGTVAVTLRPATGDWQKTSSLPKPLLYPVANTQPPSKDAGGEPWLSTKAYEQYLRDPSNPPNPSDPPDPSDLLADSTLADTEYAIGIAIDPATGTTGHGEAAGQIYTAHYLRLREDWRLGLFAQCQDKDFKAADGDLIKALLNDEPRSIIVGGQQRLCTAQRNNAPTPLPLPRGLHAAADFKQLSNGKFAVKWILLSPAIWPEIPEGVSKRGTERRFHPGGWLPNWICPQTGQVLLETVSPEERRRRRSLNYGGKGYESRPNVAARLVAAIVPKPIAVTGWALAIEAEPSEISNLQSEIRSHGAKSTHLAVPAGAVYYFEADTPEAAAQLAAALNWHGAPADSPAQSDPSDFATIKNRRSTLLGQKGYGLGVCGTWQFYETSA